MQNNFSFRRDLCVNGNSETIELDGTTEDVLRVLYALEQPAFASPCLRTMLQENLDRTQTEYEVEMDVSQLTDEEKANVERIVNKAFNTPEAKELAYLLDAQVPNSREKSLAMTNLEQAVFWANAGVARNE